ncbi:MAG TPA: hypothetical protein V6C46_05870 [Coleofasciculaceae cyanobacterium]
MPYCILDRLGETQSISLPGLGALPIGETLPEGVDLSTVKELLPRFYGDRYELVEATPTPVSLVKAVEPVEPVQQQKPRPRRKR